MTSPNHSSSEQEPKKHKHVRTYTPIEAQEVELFVRYLDGELSLTDLTVLFGRSRTYALNWIRRVTDWLYLQKYLSLQYRQRIIKMKGDY